MNAQHAIVIGGGFAGLAAGVALADAGWRVTVLERRSMLGGRARSFTDPATGEVVDNGQHVFLGCYRQTLRFLRRLGTADRVVFQDRLEVAFAAPGQGLSRLRCPRLPTPWHLGLGVFGLRHLSLADKLAMARVPSAVSHFRHRTVPQGDSPLSALDQVTVDAWLAAAGQSAASRRGFWHPLAIAALNDDPAQASALGFVSVLTQMFGRGWQGSRLGLASVGLSDLYTTQAERVITETGGAVRLNTSVAAIEGDGGRVTGIRLASGERLMADAYVATVPPNDLVRMLPASLRAQDPQLRQLHRFGASPIVSINLWLDREVADAPFVGFVGTTVQWFFNRPRLIRQPTKHVALVISAARAVVDQPNDALVAAAWAEVQQCLPAARGATLQRSQVVREPQATVTTPVGSAAWRPGPRTAWPNLYLAGDWTATGLPATIESAVASGYAAAEKMIAGPTPPR